jgi:hypothetical protein
MLEFTEPGYIYDKHRNQIQSSNHDYWTIPWLWDMYTVGAQLARTMDGIS